MSLREVRNQLIQSYDDGEIDDEEFLFLFDLNTSKNPDFPYWGYGPFDLDQMSDAECLSEFRFFKNDIYALADVLNIPEEIVCYNRTLVSGIEALCTLLKRSSYPTRYSDMIPRFGRSPPQCSIIVSNMVDMIHNFHSYRLSTFQLPWLSVANLERYANAIHAAGAPLNNCWGFVDGTVRLICRPGEHQRVVYNGHKRVHAIKFQSIVAPNGLIANLFGPVEGRRHDSGMLADSNLLPLIQQHCNRANGDPLCIYQDTAYPLRAHLQTPYLGLQLNPVQAEYNRCMSKVRAAVEWVFGDIINNFKFIDFKKNVKINLSAVGKIYIVCALLTNAHTCLYKSSTSSYFNIDPPSLEQYFS